jgi:imidazoleglycerol-phosphate dehydratase
MRTATIRRKTSETKIEIELSLDGSGQHEISTGLGFLDHMLTAVAVHGLFDLTVKAEGDLHIDSHHTIEDTAIVLGKAFAEALGDRKGISRVGHAYVPMDEALGFVALDISGRPYTVFQAAWATPAIGQFPTDLVEHFFETFAVHSGISLHAKGDGRNDHHKAEAL